MNSTLRQALRSLALISILSGCGDLQDSSVSLEMGSIQVALDGLQDGQVGIDPMFVRPGSWLVGARAISAGSMIHLFLLGSHEDEDASFEIDLWIDRPDNVPAQSEARVEPVRTDVVVNGSSTVYLTLEWTGAHVLDQGSLGLVISSNVTPAATGPGVDSIRAIGTAVGGWDVLVEVQATTGMTIAAYITDPQDVQPLDRVEALSNGKSSYSGDLTVPCGVDEGTLHIEVTDSNSEVSVAEMTIAIVQQECGDDGSVLPAAI